MPIDFNPVYLWMAVLSMPLTALACVYLWWKQRRENHE
jgi:hypothetical protein